MLNDFSSYLECMYHTGANQSLHLLLEVTEERATGASEMQRLVVNNG